ncbi:peptide-methionine (S)-S-oxide reductase MsrA [Marinomonas mediterranea]|jgi:methionine-S-sulfoxide reductase|uniref:Peptide methionine sulfoxide reductase MsrA n=1 Tax=Marinomonas mediterranea (strain ATCC 700492 / JCM 21426 / NBRC 103028 / MMB-1) TaxID=717774 RepID=F2K0J7_MARM1|nr:peptide-methionine (S)-S-oxide reductase MsrA [Marinomonas mediterranea]ADZ90981.1 Peptide methionine sulfoxide reductase msrA [Marinomonas mediterranea MMB-1]WCN09021.1 peptide-methionine (S)-S-oxide reductase MsrA [Marinomonas mediterranea]WCN13055.1 peptide-methionine (S)-S-oxide reductase MsrA [Marinomonas mediterranea]WCN17124.1 peptide-methionine (S)-S-oxide reductase MsrA [Marinomonas mediterranea MMB-1]
MKLKNKINATLLLGTIASASLLSVPANADVQSMIVAGGCFWCVESDFEKVNGVLDVVSGYTGGHTESPSYRQVAAKKTGHFEAVKITFEDSVVSLETLSNYFWKTIDPTDPHGQFCDKGSPYKTAMFYQNTQQKSLFEASLAHINKTKPFADEIVTQLLPASTFYLAEDYHQDYYTKNPLRYRFYRSSCGRDSRIKTLWGEIASKSHHN